MIDFSNPLGDATTRRRRRATQDAAGPSTTAGAPAPMGTSGDIAGAAARTNPTMGDQSSLDQLGAEVRGGGVNAVPMPTDPAQLPGGDMSQTTGDYVDEQPADMDQLLEDYIRAQLEAANNVDTSAGEALINQQMANNIGSGRVNNRAAAGAGGWGQSGMEMAVGADIENAARQQASENILGLRRDESQRAMDNAARAFGLDIEGRQAANEQMVIEAKMKALEALLAQNGMTPDPGADPGADPGSGGGDMPNPNDIFDIGPDDVAAGAESVMRGPGYDGEQAGDGSEPPEGAWDSASESSSTPSDYTEAYTHTDENGETWAVYRTADGWVKVRRAQRLGG